MDPELIAQLLAQQDASAAPPLAVNRGRGRGFFSMLRGAADSFGRNTMGRALGLLTMDPQREETQRAYRSVIGAGVDFLPGAGDVKAVAHDAPILFGEGHPVWGTVAALSAVPALGAPLDIARKLRGIEGAAEGAQRVMARHYGPGAREDVLRVDMQGTGRPGTEAANPDRQPRTFFYIPEMTRGGAENFKPEVQFRGDPYVDVEIDLENFANRAGIEEYQDRARAALRAEKAAGPNPNINPEPSPIAVENRAEQMMLADGIEGVFDETRGFAAKFSDTPLSGGATGNGVRRVAAQANEYVAQARAAGRPLDPHPEAFEYLPVSETEGRDIADLYDQLPHAPDDPQVRASYDAMKQETADQYRFLEERGVTFEPTVDDPYPNSDAMIRDVRENNRLSFFLTDLDDFPADHPLAEKSGVFMRMPDGSQREMVYNDLFRAVHDYFGHAAEGFQFGPRGEHNAWGLHASMYSPQARPAMSFETRGQNSWVNYGRQLRQGDGSLPKKGEPGYVPPAERSFADQKANILPPELSSVGGVREPIGPATSAASLVQDARRVGTRAGARFRAATASDAARTRALDDVKSNLPPDRAAIVDGLNRGHQESLIRAWTKGIDPETLAHVALAGREARGWYESSRQGIRSVFGPDSERFTAVLAASSPNVGVPKNLSASLDIWGDWLAAGRPTDEDAIRAIAKRNQPGTADFSDNLVRVLQASEDRVRSPEPLLSGPKVEPFRRNLMGFPDDVTQDVHTGRLLGGADPGTLTRNLAGQALHTAAAKRLSEWTGTHVDPREIQEMSWAFIRGLGEASNRGDMVSTLERVLANGPDTMLRGDKTLAEWMGEHHAIGDLLAAPENQARLQRLGRSAPRRIRQQGLNTDIAPDPGALLEAAERYRRSKSGRALYGIGGALGVRTATERFEEERRQRR